MHPGDTTLHNDMLVIKERLNLPSVTVDVGNYKRSEFEVVGKEDDNLFFLSIIELNNAQVFRILFSGWHSL